MSRRSTGPGAELTRPRPPGYGAQFMLAAAYTPLKGGHIRTDVFYERWSARRRATIDAAKAVIPVTAALLALQGLSELIKCARVIRGDSR